MRGTELLQMFCAEGWHLFPLVPGTKLPFEGFSWKKKSSNNFSQIRKWLEEYPGCNWALDCGKSGLAVLDVDEKKEKNGHKTLTDLPTLPETLHFVTPTGGSHFIFKGKLRSTAGHIGQGVDTRGTGGYIVIPPSKIEGKPYKIKKWLSKTSLADLPEWVSDLVGKAAEKIRSDEPVEYNDSKENVLSATQYLMHEAPIAIEGEGGDATTYQVACVVRDMGLSPITTFESMLRVWNDNCNPPWEPEELKRKVDNAYEYGVNFPGQFDPVNTFEKLSEIESKEQKKEREITLPRPVSDFSGVPVPREWVIKDWIPKHELTLLTGAGGLGKSLLALQMATCIAAGVSLLGMEVGKPMPVLFISCEDNYDELHRRLAAILDDPALNFNGIDKYHIPLYLWSRVGQPTAIAREHKNELLPTNFYKDVCMVLEKPEFRGALVFYDTVADIFAGNENDRAMVNQFVKYILGSLAAKYGVTQITIGHPPKTQGVDYSGSTAWNNAYRNRLFLKQNEERHFEDYRFLERVKSNYARTGERLMIVWDDGKFSEVTDEHLQCDKALQNKDIIYDLLVEHAESGEPIGLYHNAALYLKHVEVKDAEGVKMSWEEKRDIVNQLILEGMIKRVSGQSRANGLYPAEQGE